MLIPLPSTLEKRKGPCVWESSSLNDKWLTGYKENGFAVFQSENTFNVDQLNLDSIYGADRPGRVFESDGKTTRSQFNIHNDFPQVISKVVTKTIYQNAKTILGSEPIIYQSHINFKIPELGGNYDWHSDYCYWKAHDGMQEPRAISIVIPFDDHNLLNGGLQLIRGSHNYYYPHTLTTAQSWQVNRVRHDSDEKEMESGIISNSLISTIPHENITSLDMKWGDFAIFDANTWHSSEKNKSNLYRTTLFLVLISENTQFNESHRNYRPDYISCRKQMKLSHFLI